MEKNTTTPVEVDPKIVRIALDRVCDKYSAKSESSLKRTSLRTFMKSFVDELLDQVEELTGKPIKLDNRESIEDFRTIFGELADAVEDDSDD